MAKKSIASNSSGTILNTSSGTLTTINTNISQSIWASTSSNTAYVPNIGNTFIYQGVVLRTPTPFNIKFSWDNKEVDISLKDGNDIFKLANAFMEWLDTNEIEYNVKTNGKRKKK
jgi:hypothetical protein